MERTIVSFYNPDEEPQGVTFTPAARLHVKKILDQYSDKKCIRLSVKRSGCSGFSYVLDYVKNQNRHDLKFIIDKELDVFVDTASFPYLKGLCIDFIQKGLNGSLKFLNPNQTAACGCGESFSVEEGKIED